MKLETERLTIRPFQASDGEDLYEYLSDANVVRFEPYEPFSKKDALKEAARRATDDAFLAVCLKENGKVIGNLYLSLQEPSAFSTWEIGYVFNAAYQGCGYATESARALVEHLFSCEHAHRVIAMCNPENEPSWHLMERLGMRREGHFLQKAFFKRDEKGKPMWHDAYEYAILTQEWKNP